MIYYFNVFDLVVVCITILYLIIFAAAFIIRTIEICNFGEAKWFSPLVLSYKQARIWGIYKLPYYYIFNVLSAINNQREYHPVIDANIRYEYFYNKSNPKAFSQDDNDELTLSTYRIRYREGEMKCKKKNVGYSSYETLTLSPSTIMIIHNAFSDKKNRIKNLTESNKRNNFIN